MSGTELNSSAVSAVVSATVDDEDTYGSDIASADFDLDGGLWSGWLPMVALAKT